MLEVFNRDRQRVAILENAFGIEEDRKINALWYFRFSLPEDDPKNKHCDTLNYVRYNVGEMYRIMPRSRQSEEVGTCTYECEHVLATLIDGVMFGYHVVGNLGTYTRQSIEYVLSKQITKNWVLGECDFSRQFEYGWENENLLAALFSIATPFSEPYIWVTDTTVYPWVLSLKRLSEGLPECYIMPRRNLTSYQDTQTVNQVCTRLYPLGYGEGVNQLGIANINGGKPYLQSPPDIVAKYGIIERVWIDRRYENAESLKAAAEKMLAELQEPVLQYEIGYQEINKAGFEQLDVGKRVQIRYDDTVVNTVVTGLSLKYDDITTSTVTIANRSVDIASTVSDLADRQRIEMAYAQGATQLYAQSLQANCDRQSGARMQFFIPAEMRIVNSVKIKIQVESFRAYSKTTSTHQQQNQTSSSGGGFSQTSSSGGGGNVTSAGGGGVTEDTGPGGINVQYEWYWTKETQGHSHQYRDVVSHQHRISLPNHVHQVYTPDHTHVVNIPAHQHTVTIPAHDHEITPGIFRFGSPKSFKLYVDGTFRASFNTTGEEVDITQYLTDKQSGRIQRGAWHSVEVVPDDLAYVFLDMYVQGFVQSRGDATV